MKTIDRVQAHTAERVNQRLADEARRRVLEASKEPPKVLAERIRQIDETWDIERLLEMNASALAFTGIMMGLFVDKKWFALPCMVLPFLFLHAVQGWCPPIPALRRMGVRTRKELDAEKYALKALRGDFAELDAHGQGPLVRGQDAWHAASS
jgi:hypothetical protein